MLSLCAPVIRSRLLTLTPSTNPDTIANFFSWLITFTIAPVFV